ncbi:MAG: hypothetical protein CNLJKLNK_00580 [Holosporales bacterium]
MRKILYVNFFAFVILHGAESPELPLIIEDVVLGVLNEDPPVYKAPPAYGETFYSEGDISAETDLSTPDSFYDFPQEALPSYEDTMAHAFDSYENEAWVLRMPF